MWIQTLKVNNFKDSSCISHNKLFIFLFIASAASFCCLGCRKSFIALSSFHIHLRPSSMCAMTNPEPFICHRCNQQFTKLEYLQQYIRTHENIAQDKHCSYCEKSFLSNTLLRRHLRTHTGHKPYSIVERVL